MRQGQFKYPNLPIITLKGQLKYFFSKNINVVCWTISFPWLRYHFAFCLVWSLRRKTKQWTSPVRFTLQGVLQFTALGSRDERKQVLRSNAVGFKFEIRQQHAYKK